MNMFFKAVHCCVVVFLLNTVNAQSYQQGYQSLLQRDLNLADSLRRCSNIPTPTLNLKLSEFKQVAVTGIGTSATHAKYLVSLLRDHLSIPAYFKPVGSFLNESETSYKEEVLIVISQGLSPNVRVTLERQEAWGEVILITAATLEGAVERNEHQKYDLLKRVLNNRGQIIQFTGENEYETLIRLTGPVTGFVMMNKVAESFAALKGVRPKIFDISIETIVAKMAQSRKRAQQVMAALDDNWIYDANHFIVCNGEAALMDNLRFKLMEGLFIPIPGVWDLLDYSHGPLQQNYEVSANFFRLKGERINEALFSRFDLTLNPKKHKAFDVKADLPFPYSLFEYESFFNTLVLDAIRKHQIDQVNWPAKGVDTALYSFEGKL